MSVLPENNLEVYIGLEAQASSVREWQPEVVSVICKRKSMPREVVLMFSCRDHPPGVG